MSPQLIHTSSFVSSCQRPKAFDMIATPKPTEKPVNAPTYASVDMLER